MKMLLVKIERFACAACLLLSILLLGSMIEGDLHFITALCLSILSAVSALLFNKEALRTEAAYKRHLARTRRRAVSRAVKHEQAGRLTATSPVLHTGTLHAA